MPEFKFACGERLLGSTHDADGVISVKKAPRRRKGGFGGRSSRRRSGNCSPPPGVRMIRIVYHLIDRTI